MTLLTIINQNIEVLIPIPSYFSENQLSDNPLRILFLLQVSHKMLKLIAAIFVALKQIKARTARR